MAQLPIRLSIEGNRALQLGEAKASPFAHWRTNPLPLAGLLKRLRNIYKGQNCGRYYCSQKCLKDGEERAAQYAQGRIHVAF
jgi:hypothetical protein